MRWRTVDPVGMPVLLSLTAVSLALLAVRVPLSGGPAHGFLVWNLFLAWLPLPCAWAALHAHERGGRVVALGAGAAWLVVFPNAPYLVTDLIHVELRPTARFLYDGMLFSSFALLGLLLGGAALRPVHHRVDTRFGARGGLLLLGAMGLLIGFGVYLGRVRRWNSWAVLQEPLPLASDIWTLVTDPLSHGEPVAVTLGFGTFFLLAYVLTVGVRPAPAHGRRPPS